MVMMSGKMVIMVGKQTAHAEIAASARSLAAVRQLSPERDAAKRDRGRKLIVSSPCRPRLDDEESSSPRNRDPGRPWAWRPSCRRPYDPWLASFATRTLRQRKRKRQMEHRRDHGSVRAQRRPLRCKA